jgi:hypothetical protein
MRCRSLLRDGHELGRHVHGGLSETLQRKLSADLYLIVSIVLISARRA